MEMYRYGRADMPRAIIIHKDNINGYGLTVSGDNPVSVQTIKQGGAADIAGIREGDVIIKVNGTPVQHMNHTEVVELIRAAGTYVTLTVRPADMNNMPGMVGGNGARSHQLQMSHDRRVTAPLPANHDGQRQMMADKLSTLMAFREQSSREVDRCFQKYKQTQSPKDLSELERVRHQLAEIEKKLNELRGVSPSVQLHNIVPFGGAAPTSNQLSYQPPQFLGPGQPLQQQRNRNPLSVHGGIGVYPSSGHRGSWDHGADVPPPLPPRSNSQSFSSADSSLCTSPSFPGHEYPDNGIINTATNNHSPAGYGGNKNHVSPTSSEGLSRAHHSHHSGASLHANSGAPQTHHRAKSSPDPVSMQKALKAADEAKRSDSFNDLTKCPPNRLTKGEWRDSVDSGRQSPPGSPPPPYGQEGGFNEDMFSKVPNYSANDFSPTKCAYPPFAEIMSMEEDDGLCPPDGGQNSIFNNFGSLSKLMKHNAHLAVFMNYVIESVECDPSSLLFYLITEMYINDTSSSKDMKRWAYEIHSTFTAPGAPLLVPHVDENIAKEIDDELMHECDKEEMMRRIFRKARNRAKEEINRQLENFSSRLTAGLGSMYGPPDYELEESASDRAKEQRIIEEYMLPRLSQLHGDYEQKNEDRLLAILCASATVMQKQFNIRSSAANGAVLEKYATYVTKEKSAIQKRLLNRNKKVPLNGHHFAPMCYQSYVNCTMCGKLLWGVGPQGYLCLDCNMNVHRGCLKDVTDVCVECDRKKEKSNEKFRKFRQPFTKDRDQKRRPTSLTAGKWIQELSGASFSSSDADTADRTSSTGNHTSSGSNLRGIDERRPDTVNEENFSNDNGGPGDPLERAPVEPKRTSNAVTRSESCKEPGRVQRKLPRDHRKRSDPNLGSKSSDADLDNQRHLSDANNSGSSSTSSISRSLESPQSASLELVNQSSTSLPGQRGSETPETTQVHHHHSSAEGKHHHHAWPHHYTYFADGDSDIEVEQDPPDLAKIVPEEELSRMDRKEKKRQEVLNELCHTERSHVRNLKVLDRLFHRPIRQKEMIPGDLVQVVFSNLENMLELHEKFNNALKKKRKENPVIDEIGALLLETFDGENGTYFKSNAAFFCSKQQIGLELLKERRRQDPKFHTFLAEQEANPVCRRLQVNDMIPMAMQRLTKYPLLFESLCNCTPPDSEEYKKIQRAVELSREILSSVNRKKKEAENHQRLVDIQKSLDKSYLDKNIDKADSSVIGELKNLDFTNHRLLLEGPLRWRMLPSKGSKQKSDFLDVQAVLLDDMIVLLLKDNDRLVLKMHHWSIKSPTVHVRPIIRFQNLRLSENAAENRAFFIINTASTNMNMYELWCSSKDERTKWLQHIKEAVDDYKTRQEESKRGDAHPASNNIPAVAPEADDKFKDVNDSGEAHPTPAGDSSTQNGDDGGQAHEGFSKDASPAPDSLIASANLSPSAAAGNASSESQKNSTVSPNPNRRKGEFLRITESAPLIQPCEVVVATRDVQFATPVVSQYEELKRIDAEIGKLMDTKNKLLTKLSPQPASLNGDGSTTTGSDAVARLESPGSNSSHAKQLVTACLLQVDQLGRLLATQKITAESLAGMRDPVAIHQNLNGLLTQLLLEIQRRDEDSEMRRQELSRIREQNHGYQERLQVRNGSEKHVSPVRQSTPNASPSHSRPNSFLSLSSSSDQHEEDHGDGKVSRSKTAVTAGVPEPTVGDTEEDTSRSNGHMEQSARAPPVDMTAIISAVLDEQKPMKDNMILGDGENESGKALHSLIEETIEPQRKLS